MKDYATLVAAGELSFQEPVIVQSGSVFCSIGRYRGRRGGGGINSC